MDQSLIEDKEGKKIKAFSWIYWESCIYLIKGSKICECNWNPKFKFQEEQTLITINHDFEQNKYEIKVIDK